MGSQCCGACRNGVAGAIISNVEIRESHIRQPLKKPWTTGGIVFETANIGNGSATKSKASARMCLDNRTTLLTEDLRQPNSSKREPCHTLKRWRHDRPRIEACRDEVPSQVCIASPLATTWLVGQRCIKANNNWPSDLQGAYQGKYLEVRSGVFGEELKSVTGRSGGNDSCFLLAPRSREVYANDRFHFHPWLPSLNLTPTPLAAAPLP